MFQGFLALLIQIALTAAAPIEAQTKNDILGYRIGGGIGFFIVLFLDIIVWFEVLQSTRPVPRKLLWCLLVLVFPIVGVILYFLFANRAAHRRGYEVIP